MGGADDAGALGGRACLGIGAELGAISEGSCEIARARVLKNGRRMMYGSTSHQCL